MADKKKKKVSVKLPDPPGRPKPSSPTSGIRVDGSRYGKGGKVRK